MTVAQKRTMLWGTLGLALLAGLAWAFAPRPVPVDLTVAERGPLTVTIDEEGETRVRDVYTLSAPVAGRQRRVELEVGDRVVAGDTIAVEIQPIDPELLDVRSEREARAAVQAAEAAQARAAAELERAEADLEYAQTELQRQQGLMDQGAVSERELDAAQREYRTARAAVATARAALQQATFELDRARARLVSPTEAREDGGADCCIPVRSPVTGRVLRVLHESAGVVQAGEPLLEIGDPEDLEIVVDLLSADAVKVSPGDRALIEEWGGEGALGGRVRRVEPYGFTKVSALGIEEQRVNVVIDFTDPRETWSRLGHGYRVEARIVVWEREDVLQIPLSALFRRGEDWAVFAVEDGVARLRTVERGQHDGLRVEILGGLDAGDRVVRYPSDQIRDGVRIEQR
jgi:HlyD family secretion protein